MRRALLAWPALHAWALAPKVLAGPGRDAPPLALTELRLLASQLDPLVPFYRDTLGLDLVQRDDGQVSFAAGTTRMTFLRADAGQRPYYHIAFNIPENKLSAAMEWTRPRFELIPRTGTDDPVVHFRTINAHSVYFFDPVGNLLEFIARHDLDNAGRGAFGPADLLNTSEIGIVVDDVQGFASQAQATFGLGALPGTQPTERFAVVGSHEGTFIIVRRGRIWLMTDDLEGAVFPTEVIVKAPRPGELDVPGHPYKLRAV